MRVIEKHVEHERVRIEMDSPLTPRNKTSFKNLKLLPLINAL
jgi:hypothetical protein